MNILKILNYFHIEYATQGPKIGKGVIGVHCPCCNHAGFYRGIFIDNGINSCWSCHNSMSLFHFLKMVKGISYDEYSKVAGITPYTADTAKKNLDTIFHTNEQKEEEPEHTKFADIKGIVPVHSNTLIDKFLDERKFPITLLEKFNSYYGRSGDYFGHLVIPIPAPFNGPAVTFIARDLTGTSKKKYLFPKYCNIGELVYFTRNWKNIKYTDTIYLVEGIFDAWAIDMVGGIAGCLFGKKISIAQVNYLNTYLPRAMNVVIMLDGDTNFNESINCKNMLEPFFKNLKIKSLRNIGKDPCDIHRMDLKKLIEMKGE